MESLIVVVSVAVGILLLWAVVSLMVRERRLKREKSPLLGVVYPLDKQERADLARKQRIRAQHDRDTEN